MHKANSHVPLDNCRINIVLLASASDFAFFSSSVCDFFLNDKKDLNDFRSLSLFNRTIYNADLFTRGTDVLCRFLTDIVCYCIYIT